jgi:outer membrane protein OmpA-like peptidoglycan-associated protein
MNSRMILAALVGIGALLTPAIVVVSSQSNAARRLAASEAEAAGNPPEVATAAAADSEYCTGELRTILRRVLTSCGLMNANGRGCQPIEARNVATMSGSDFNALFVPMKARGAIVQFDHDASDLDAQDLAMIDRVYAARGGASYFFVVARTSPEGSAEHNRELSQARAESVLAHLRATFDDPEMDRQVGLLSLGEEYAQLETTFCDWERSGGSSCTSDELNRSAFVAWIDCRL